MGGLGVLNVLNALRALRAPRSIHARLVPRVLGLFGLALAAGVVQAGGDAPPACDRATFAIAIDPGHTRAEPGATSARGVSERAFNEALRRAGFGRTFATHPDDAPSLALVERTRIAAERGARLFVSIHHDSVQPQHLQTWLHRGSARHQTPSIRGHSLFVSGRLPSS